LKITVCSPVSLTNFSGAAKFLIQAARLMNRHGHDVNVSASPFGPNKTISLSEVQNLLSPVSYYETKQVTANADVTYVNYAPFIWRNMRINGAKIAGLHTHLLLPNQHIAETLLHPVKAGSDWYTKATSFAAAMPAIKADIMSFDAAHIPMGNFSLPGLTRLYKIPLWIDFKRIPVDAPSKADKFTVLFVGRKTWEKGWLTFCSMSSILKRRGYDFEFLCTGKGSEGVRGLRFLSEDELRRVYQRSHIVVYPSIADMFGLVILEAASYGVPVVTTPIEVHRELDLPLFYARTSAEFAETVLRTYSIWKENLGEYYAWCKRLQFAARKYDVDKVFPLFERMIKNTANKEKSRTEPLGSAGWNEPTVAFGHKSEKLSRNQRIKELNWAAASLQRVLGGVALDIGGGKGYVAKLLNEIGCKTVGLDIKPSFVQQMVNAGLPAVLADGGKLPFRSSTFDLVTCFEMLEHVANPEGVLEEISRVLRKKGLLVLTTPTANPINTVVDSVRGEKTHISEMPWRVLVNLVGKHFNKVVCKPILSLPIPPSLFGRYHWFETDILANHVWVCCEK